MKLPPAILLAAGRSSRLGSPKQMISFEQETLLERTARIAAAAGADPIFIVLGSYAETMRNLHFPENVVLVLNDRWEEGVASSIRAGMQAALAQNKEAGGVLLMVCDQPAVTVEHLRTLISEAQRGGGTWETAASSYAGVTGTPAIFPATRFQQVLALQGDTGARALLRDPAHPPLLISLPQGEIDIDTTDDLINWQNQSKSQRAKE